MFLVISSLYLALLNREDFCWDQVFFPLWVILWISCFFSIIYFIFLLFPFGFYFYLQKNCKKWTNNSHIPFIHFLQMLTFYICFIFILLFPYPHYLLFSPLFFSMFVLASFLFLCWAYIVKILGPKVTSVSSYLSTL